MSIGSSLEIKTPLTFTLPNSHFHIEVPVFDIKGLPQIRQLKYYGTMQLMLLFD